MLTSARHSSEKAERSASTRPHTHTHTHTPSLSAGGVRGHWAGCLEGPRSHHTIRSVRGRGQRRLRPARHARSPAREAQPPAANIYRVAFTMQAHNQDCKSAVSKFIMAPL